MSEYERAQQAQRIKMLKFELRNATDAVRRASGRVDDAARLERSVGDHVEHLLRCVGEQNRVAALLLAERSSVSVELVAATQEYQPAKAFVGGTRGVRLALPLQCEDRT